MSEAKIDEGRPRFCPYCQEKLRDRRVGESCWVLVSKVTTREDVYWQATCDFCEWRGRITTEVEARWNLR